MNQDIVVGKSKISGKGVFAGKNFKKGEIILTWHPKIFTKNEFEKLSKEAAHFTYEVGGKYLYMQPPEKYVNHSCDANTKTDGLSDAAIRDIKKGEEITANYNNDGMVKFECKCGSKNCRGSIS